MPPVRRCTRLLHGNQPQPVLPPLHSTARCSVLCSAIFTSSCEGVVWREGERNAARAPQSMAFSSKAWTDDLPLLATPSWGSLSPLSKALLPALLCTSLSENSQTLSSPARLHLDVVSCSSVDMIPTDGPTPPGSPLASHPSAVAGFASSCRRPHLELARR
jgi:hypothetical protein